MPFYRDVNSLTPTNRPDVTDVDAVTQSLLNLIRTKRGEVPFNPTYGIALEDSLFDLMDEGTSLRILADIANSIDSFEPRVDLETGDSTVELFEDDNRIVVTLIFSIKGFSDEDKLFEVTQSFTR